MKTNQSERKAINERCCYRGLENGRRRLIWEITSRCNLRCRHCFVSTNSTDDADLAACLRVVDLLRELGTFGKIMITGGEPFAREDLFQILSRIQESLPDVVVDLTTNMTLLDEASIQRLARMGIDELTVSLDGVGEIHDAVRGSPGCFERVEENIKAARRHGLFIDVVTVVSTMNFHQLPAIAAKALEWDCSSLTFSGVIDRHDKPIDQRLLLDDFQLRHALGEIEACRQNHLGVLPVRTVGFDPSPSFLCTKESVLSISSDGWIERCLLSRTSMQKRNINDPDLTVEAFDVPRSSPSECF